MAQGESPETKPNSEKLQRCKCTSRFKGRVTKFKSRPSKSKKNSSDSRHQVRLPVEKVHKQTQNSQFVRDHPKLHSESATRKHSHFVDDPNRSDDAHFYALNPTSELQESLDSIGKRIGSHTKSKGSVANSRKHSFLKGHHSRISSQAHLKRTGTVTRLQKVNRVQIIFVEIPTFKPNPKPNLSNPPSESDLVHHQIFDQHPHQDEEPSTSANSNPKRESEPQPKRPTPPLPVLDNETPLNPRKTPESIPDRPFVTDSIYNDLLDLGRFSHMQWDKNYHPCYEEKLEAFGIQPLCNCAEINQRFDTDDPPPPFPPESARKSEEFFLI
ncbi:hypothetical protein Ocin01_07505 [Orchesella cincta]|uniref:Uncharacterized protein n=1 Tax=Orchesella cincta TaxID=48709 RepID=A0A1D2N299_ORCCI|nr:hypothetical protein Ocin01_07505 [Orchesella cincta]